MGAEIGGSPHVRVETEEEVSLVISIPKWRPLKHNYKHLFAIHLRYLATRSLRPERQGARFNAHGARLITTQQGGKATP